MTSKKNIGGDRPRRFCPLCQQVDDHPRHVKTTDPDDNVTEHMDCCRERGCPDGSCDVVAARGMADARGGELLVALQADDGLAAAVEEEVAKHVDPRSTEQILSERQFGRTLLQPDGR